MKVWSATMLVMVAKWPLVIMMVFVIVIMNIVFAMALNSMVQASLNCRKLGRGFRGVREKIKRPIIRFCHKFTFKATRSYDALRAADLHWNVRPGHSWDG